MKTLTETSTFTADVDVPEDIVDNVTGSTVETGFQALANRTAYLKAVADDLDPRIAADEWTYPTPKTRVLLLPVSASLGESDSSGTPEWSTVLETMSSAISQGANVRRWWRPVLPAGATITKVRALVNPGAANTGGDRMYLQVARFTVSGTTVSSAFSVGPYYDNESTGDQWIDSGTIELFVIAGTFIEATVRSANEASGDRVRLLEITYSDPGPRNAYA